MNIGIFTDSYKPYVSGVVRSVDMLQRGLRRHGDDVSIFAPDYPAAEFDEADEPPIYRFRGISFSTNRSFRVPIPISLHVGETLKKLDLDLIHSQSPFMMGQLAAWSARREQIPLVFTFHTLYHLYTHYVPMVKTVPLAEHVVRDIVVHWTRDYANAADHVVAPSRPVIDHLEQLKVETPITVIPTGVDLAPFRLAVDDDWLKHRFQLPPSSLVMLYAGRLGHEKNIPFLLRCFRLVVEQRDDIHLVLVGGGPIQSELEQKVREMGLKERVWFTGEMAPEQMPVAYAGGDVFVFPSKSETQGLAIVEAMASGLPVLAVEAGGVVDVIDHGQGGYLLAEDENLFAQTALKLLSDRRLHEEQSEKARQQAEQFSVETMVERTRTLYARVMAGHAKSWSYVG